MKIDFNRLDDLNARMTLVVEYADYGPKLDENIKKYSKKVAIKGFRSGKTPKSVLTKMYGKGMLEETVNGILNEKLFGYLDGEKIGFFGSPLMAEDAHPIDFDAKSHSDYTFVFDLGLKPVFDLQYNLEIPLEISIPAIDHAGLDEDVIRYRRVFGEDLVVTDDKVEPNDKVGFSLQRLIDGKPDDLLEVASVSLDNNVGEAKDALLDLKNGAILDVDLEKFLGYERSVILKNTLHLEEDPSPGEPLNYRITVTSIHRPQKTELTGEQLTKFTGKEMQDEAEFRQFLEEREVGNNEARVNDMKKMAIRKSIMANNPFNIPEDFLFRWVNQQREKPIEPGSHEADTLFRDAKWSLLLNKIATEEALEVTEKDIQRQMTNWIIQNVNYMQTDIKKLMDRLYANEYFMSTMKESALEEVVFTHILPRYHFLDKEVSAEGFEKAFHDLHHEIFNHGDHHDHDHGDGHHHHHDHEHSHDHSEHSHG